MAMKRPLLPLIMLATGTILGVLSAARLLDGQAEATSADANAWQEWRGGGDDLRNTYFTGHFLSQGQVPPPKGTRLLVRSTDDEGQTLRGSCVISVEGKLPAARWWFVAATSGRQRVTLDAAQAVREADGSTVIAVASAPTPGNWLVPPGDGAYELQLVLLGVDDTAALAPGSLPRVRKLWC